MSDAGRLGRNLRWLLGSEAGARALGFAYTALVARLLGLEGFGLLSLGLVYGEILALALGMSFHEVFVREVLQRGRAPAPILAAMVRIQLVAAIPGLVLAVGLGSLYDGPSRWLLPFAALIGLARALARTYLAVSVALEDFRPRSVYGVLDRGAALLAGLLLAAFSFGVVGLLATLAGGAFLTAAYAHHTSRAQVPLLQASVARSTPAPAVPGPDATVPSAPPASVLPAPTGATAPEATWRLLLREGLSFSALRWMGVVHNRVDTLLLQSLVGPAALGIYSAAYRLMEVFKIVPNLAEQTLFPNLSRLGSANGEASRQAVGRAFHLLFAVLAPLVVAAATLGPAAVDLVFGAEFAGAARPWVVLMAALVFVALGRPFLVRLRASGDLRSANLLSAGAVVVNLGLNVLWIPRYGPTGAALATLASEAAFVVVCLTWKRHLAVGLAGRTVRTLPALASAILVAVLLRDLGPWPAAVGAGLVYAAIVWRFGLSADDRAGLRAALRGRS